MTITLLIVILAAVIVGAFLGERMGIAVLALLIILLFFMNKLHF